MSRYHRTIAAACLAVLVAAPLPHGRAQSGDPTAPAHSNLTGTEAGATPRPAGSSVAQASLPAIPAPAGAPAPSNSTGTEAGATPGPACSTVAQASLPAILDPAGSPAPSNSTGTEAGATPRPACSTVAHSAGQQSLPASAGSESAANTDSAGPKPAPLATETAAPTAAASSGARSAKDDTAALIDGLLDTGRAWLEENFETEELEPLTPEQIDQLVARLQPVADSLAVGNIEDFAALKPQAAALLAWLRQQPWGAPYADWLAPRMDYLDLAAEAVAVSQRRWAEEQRRRQRPPPATTARPPAPDPIPGLSGSTLRFEVVRDRVYRTAFSRNVWAKRISERRPPARAAALAPRLKEVFRAEGVPPEWIWLAEVESSFDPEARSPVGARGLFQFMPATAKRFGLSTFPFDERTHPEKSARAAAQYLRLLHARFGDWPLALAAYNAGEGRISRELAKVPRRSFDEIAPRLPAETRFYVPKVLATVAARENVDPFSLPAPMATITPRP